MVKFKSFKEFDAWADQWQGEPVLIDDGWRMSMDMTVYVHSAAAAVNAFSDVFQMPETKMLLQAMRSAVDDGTYMDCARCLDEAATQSMWDNIGGYKWAVERVDDGEWYVFLNATGNFLGRCKAA